MAEKIGPLNVENGPTQDQINEWKAKFGEIYVAKFSDDEKYIYRPLKRFEYKQILALGQTDNKAFAEEKIVAMCIVWPVIEATKVPTLKAGTINTLVELIMEASNFGIKEEPVKL